MTGTPKRPDGINVPPFETEDLRANLAKFLDAPFQDPSGRTVRVGHYKWGIYAFFDYDGEPIYVGQTNEMLRTRIRRHLTNQRTDAVAMSVLDPFEVLEIEVWPLPQFQTTPGTDRDTRQYLDALERLITDQAVADSRFKADHVYELRSHPDFRIARRALIISRLAQVISERKVQGGLRRVLLTQAKRLQWLAERRYEALGGAASVAEEDGEES